MALRSLKGVVAVVTGGSSGLGKATALRFAKNGAKLALMDLASTDGDSVAQEIKHLGGDCIFTPADVTNTGQVESALKRTKDSFGESPRVLVNCAGFAIAKRMFSMKKQESHDLESFEKIFKVNVSGTFNVIRLIVPYMREHNLENYSLDRERGCIINCASISAYEGQIGQGG